MRWFSLLAIFFLAWFMTLFAVLPFSANTAEEAGETMPTGHAESAPYIFRPWQIVIRTTIIAVILTGTFYGIYRAGWLDVDIPKSAVDRLP
jgi:predicted secreted protein